MSCITEVKHTVHLGSVLLSFSNEAVGCRMDPVTGGGCGPVMPSTISMGTTLLRTAGYNYVFSESVRIFIRALAHLNESCLMQFWLLGNKLCYYGFLQGSVPYDKIA